MQTNVLNGKIQGDGRKFLDRFKSYFGSFLGCYPRNTHGPPHDCDKLVSLCRG